MKTEQREILEQVAEAGSVRPDTFKGRGSIVAGMVRRGWLEWERGKAPKTLNATALLITDAGRVALTSH